MWGGGSFILFQLSTQVFSKHLSKATKEPLNCGVQFEPISQVQHGAIFCFSSLSALRSTRLLNGSADLGPRVCISICSLVHQCVLVSSEERAGGGGQKPHTHGQARGGCLEPHRSDIKASSDPWNTIKPDTHPLCLTPLGQTAK